MTPTLGSAFFVVFSLSRGGNQNSSVRLSGNLRLCFQPAFTTNSHADSPVQKPAIDHIQRGRKGTFAVSLSPNARKKAMKGNFCLPPLPLASLAVYLGKLLGVPRPPSIKLQACKKSRKKICSCNDLSNANAVCGAELMTFP